MLNDRSLIVIDRNSYTIFLVVFYLAICLVSIMTCSLPVFVLQNILYFFTLPILLKERKTFLKLVILIYIISATFMLLVYVANLNAFGSPYYLGGSDDLSFELKGKNAEYSGVYDPAQLLGTVLSQNDNAPFFSVYLAVIIGFSKLFGGYTTFLPRIANIFFLIWIMAILKRLMVRYFEVSQKNALISLLIFGLTPNIQYLNSHVFRDTFNLFQVMLLVFLVLELIRNTNILKRIVCIVLLFIVTYVTYFTRQNSILFSLMILFAYWFSYLRKRGRISLFFGLVFFILLSAIVMVFIIKFSNIGFFLSFYSDYLAEGTSNSLSSVVFNRPLFPVGIILRFIYGLFTPFPNIFVLFENNNYLLYDIIRLLIYTGVMVQILFIPFVMKQLIKMDTVALSFLLSYIIVITTTFSFRHVLFYYPFMVALGVRGFRIENSNKRKITVFSSGVCVTLLGIIFIIIY